MYAIPARETADVIDAYFKNVVGRYNLKETLVNVCTDRGSANKKVFLHSSPTTGFFRELWLPCTCHMLNHFLGTFIAEIKSAIEPVCKLVSAFHGLPRFGSHLRQNEAPRVSIPKSVGIVRTT
jgi:hypothetical protein